MSVEENLTDKKQQFGVSLNEKMSFKMNMIIQIRKK